MIDEALRRYLDEIAPPVGTIPPADDWERARAARALMAQAPAKRGRIPGLPNDVETSDVTISTRGLTARLYTPPAASGPLPLMVYAHGGGWVVGSVETHDPFCRLLSGAAGVMMLSVEYRLAPEHPFPAALEDVLAAYGWAADRAEMFGGDPQRLVLGGDSAGANLAAVAANQICAMGTGTRPAGLLLLYPVTDHPSSQHASYREYATGYGLEAAPMRWFWEQYARGVSPDDARISPLRLRDLPALPPAFVATAEYDVLRDEGMAYAEKLAKAGVEVRHMHARDMHHNFAVHPGTVARFPQSMEALAGMAEWLKRP